VLVAVSGGADSAALLSTLVSIGQRVGVAHVHHGLRAEAADADLEFVRARARDLGVPFHGAHVDAARRDGRSPEARARALRYAALERVRSGGGYLHVATAHTLDDQAETLLLRAVRGTGPRGLAGVAPRWPEAHLIRPLLDVRRAELHLYLEARALEWREDSSNLDPAVPRSRLRGSVLPELEAIHPGATRKLAELASSVRETEQWLAEQVAAALERCTFEGGGGHWLEPVRLLELPRPLLHRALARLFERAGLRESVTRVHLARSVRFLEQGRRATRLSLPDGHVLVRAGQRFWIGAEPGPDASSRQRGSKRETGRVATPRVRPASPARL
jgi:tRNA(Ile)-lysidine synthase